MTFAIDVEGLSKTYRSLGGRSQVALTGLSLRVTPGAAFGLIGPNGAGKTTFIKALLGVVRPDAGRIRLLGGDPEDPRIRARLGYLPERLHLPAAWSPLEFLSSVARLKGLKPAPAELRRLLERVGLAEAEGRRLGELSKGMKQRMGLAAALVGAPELLVLDEPTDGIDPLGRAEVRAVLSEELRRGATLFLNSHLLAETERICTRIGILVRGALAREGELTELRRAGPTYRVRFAPGLPTDALAPLGFSRTGAPDTFQVAAADASALNGLLDRARATGALLVELTQETKDLETVFQEAVQA